MCYMHYQCAICIINVLYALSMCSNYAISMCRLVCTINVLYAISMCYMHYQCAICIINVRVGFRVKMSSLVWQFAKVGCQRLQKQLEFQYDLFAILFILFSWFYFLIYNILVCCLDLMFPKRFRSTAPFLDNCFFRLLIWDFLWFYPVSIQVMKTFYQVLDLRTPTCLMGHNFLPIELND